MKQGLLPLDEVAYFVRQVGSALDLAVQHAFKPRDA